MSNDSCYHFYTRHNCESILHAVVVGALVVFIKTVQITCQTEEEIRNNCVVAAAAAAAAVDVMEMVVSIENYNPIVSKIYEDSNVVVFSFFVLVFFIKVWILYSFISFYELNYRMMWWCNQLNQISPTNTHLNTNSCTFHNNGHLVFVIVENVKKGKKKTKTASNTITLLQQLKCVDPIK